MRDPDSVGVDGRPAAAVLGEAPFLEVCCALE